MREVMGLCQSAGLRRNEWSGSRESNPVHQLGTLSPLAAANYRKNMVLDEGFEPPLSQDVSLSLWPLS